MNEGYFTCTECGHAFDSENPFGTDIQCPKCEVWLETDMEEGQDSLSFWVVGKSKDQGPH